MDGRAPTWAQEGALDMTQVRRAVAHWSGDLQTGGGAVSAATSGIFSDQGITWKARTESADGLTSPEELLAAAHAACFSMAVSNELSKAGFVPERVDVGVDVEADRREKGWTVLASHITLRARVPGVDQATFERQAELARAGCPISRALSPDVAITLEATLVA
jgi:osmotically inducible protein OsmC